MEHKINGWVYIVANSYKPVLGGVQTVASQLAEGLVRRGIKCRVITKLYPKNLAISQVVDGVPVKRFPFFNSGGGMTHRILNWVALLLTFLEFARRRPTIVYVHFPEAVSLPVLRLRKLFGYKIVTCFHGHDVMRHYDADASKHLSVRNAQSGLIAASCAITCCSKFLCGVVRQHFNPQCPVIPVYNAVDLNRFRTEVGHRNDLREYLFAWGRLIPNKGYDVLINAFARVTEEYPALKLIIAGDGEMKAALEHQINNLGLTGKVHLVGRLTPDEIVTMTKNACVNVISSLQEAFGIVGLEALAAGRPVVSSDRGGLPEVLTGTDAILVAPEPDALADGIRQALSGSNNMDMTQRWKYLDGFSMNKMLDNYIDAAFLKHGN